MSESKPTAKDQPIESRWRRRTVFGVSALVLVALVSLIVRLTPITQRFYTDAETIREPIDSAITRDILWQPPRPLDEIINTAADDYEPRLSADGSTLYFVRGKAGSNADIFMSRRIVDGWTEPTLLLGVNSEHDDLGPEPSANGRSLYFYSDRAGGHGGYDLWVAHRDGDTWLPPINLGPRVNSPFNDYGPALTPDGAVLYFASNRPRAASDDDVDPNAWPATLREDLYRGDYDLYLAALSEGGVEPARALTSLNTPHNEGAPAISSFGDFVYFASDRPGGEGAFDLYRARRLDGAHRFMENLGPTVNTLANELDPGLSLGGFSLYFSSDRTAANEPKKAGAYDLYYTTSREVFADATQIARTPINWAAIWSKIWPNLLWALFALLLLLLLFALMRDTAQRQLGLITKCLLASIMAHLLLLLLMTLYDVTASIAGEFHRRGKIQIALASPSSMGDLTAQVLGDLTEIATPPAETIETERAPTEQAPDTPTPTARLAVARHVITETERPHIDTAVDDAAIRETIDRDFEPLPVTLATPTELSPMLPPVRPPVSDSEPVIDSPRHVSASVVDQRAKSLTTRADNQPTVEVAPAETDEVTLPGSSQPLLLAATAATDADVQPDAEIVVARSSFKLEWPEQAGLDVTLADSPQQASAGEPAAQRVSAAVNTPRATLHVKADNAERRNLLRDLQPAGDVIDDPSQAIAIAPPQPIDATIAQSEPGATMIVEAKTNVTPLEELALPIPELASHEARNDPVPELPAIVNQTHRRAITPSNYHAESGVILKRFDPTPLDRQSEPVQVLKTDAESIVDASTPFASSHTSATPRNETVMPALFDISLPSVEERTVRSRAEPNRSTAVQIPSSIRPAIALAASSFSATQIEPAAPEVAFHRSRGTDVRILMVKIVDASYPREVAFPDDFLPRYDTFKDFAPLPLDLHRPVAVPYNAIGVMQGVVRDAVTGQPITSATVRLDVPDAASVTANTDLDGRYVLFVPEVPDFFALSAIGEGYIPDTVSVEAAMLGGNTLELDFQLEPVRDEVIVTEIVPGVHHLGDNRFDGRINSKFQKRSEGAEYRTEFEIAGDQFPLRASRAEVRLLAKGVQRRHAIFINGTILDDRLQDAPRDGSFGAFVAPFDPSLLLEGTNILDIVAAPSKTDIDDFEFVNVQIHLLP